MKRQSIILLSILSLALSSVPAFGQYPAKSIGDDNARLRTQENRNVSSFREIKGIVVDSIANTPVQSALVSFFNSSDRVGHTSTDKNGRFRITDVWKNNLRVEITHLGYRIKVLAPNGPGEVLDMGRITMGEDVKKIDELVVKARMNFFTIKGDTVVINPEAVKTMEGDMAIDILRRIPGVEIKNGRITVLGDEITATFVDGKRIYGHDNNKALHHVEARNVAGVEIYDEIDIAEYEATGRVKRKKVANINTFKEFTQNILADAFFNGGANTAAGPDGRRDFRYAGGGGGAFYSEKRRFHVDASTDNTYLTRMKYGEEGHISAVNYTPNESMRRTTGVSAGYAWEIGRYTIPITLEDGRQIEKHREKRRFEISYSYDNIRDRGRSTRRLAYTPSSEFAGRILGDTSASATLNRRHAIHFGMNSYGSLLQILNIDASTVDDNSDIRQRSLLTTDETVTARTAVTNRSRHRNSEVSAVANLGKNWDKWSMRANIIGSYTYDDGDGIRVDTAAGSANRYSLVIPSSGHRTNAQVSVDLDRHINRNLRIGIRPTLNYSDGKTRTIATDELTGLIDSASTADYSAGSLNHTLAASLNWKKGFGTLLVFSAGYQLDRLNQDDRFPENTADRDLFINPYTYLTAEFTTASRTKLSLSYTLNPTAPAISQLRDRIDTGNPLWLSTGNPSLKSSMRHSVRGYVSKFFMKQAVNLGVSFNGTYTGNVAARRSRVFTEDTYLPAYGYTAVKGATLQDYVNISGEYHIQLSPSVSFPIRALNTKVNASVSGNISSTPTMSGTERIDIGTAGGQFALSFKSDISDKAEITVSSVTSLSRNSNGRISYNDLSENLSAVIRCDITSRLFLNTSYLLAFRRTSYRGIPTQHDNLWNVTAGVRLLRQKTLNLSVSVYDILDSNNPFSVALHNDYIAEEWKQMYSRYFTFNISYRINRKK